MSASNISSNSTYQTCGFARDTNEIRNAKIAAVFMVTLGGVFWNATILFLVCKRRMRKNIHYFVVNMALADCLVLLLTGITKLKTLFSVYDWSLQGVLGDMTCKIVFFMKFASRFVSLITLLTISFERYRLMKVIHQPISTRTRRVALLSCWLISIFLCANVLSVYRVLSFGGNHYCFPAVDAPSWMAYYLVLTAIVIIIFFALAGLSVSTIKQLRNSQALCTLPERQRKQRKRNVCNAVKMVASSLILFALCSVPYYSYLFMSSLAFFGFTTGILPICFPWRKIHFVVELLLLVNSALNPAIYLVFLTDFRQAFMSLCRRLENGNQS